MYKKKKREIEKPLFEIEVICNMIIILIISVTLFQFNASLLNKHIIPWELKHH